MRLLGRRFGVAAGGEDPAVAQELDQLERAGQLRCERDVGHGPGGDQPLEQRRVRVAASGGGVHAEPGGREERSFQVAAEHARTDIALRHGAHRVEQLRLRRPHERRPERRDAAREERLTCAAIAVEVSPGEVDPAEAVHVEVDEARDRDPRAPPARNTDACDTAGVDLDVARHEHAVDHRRLDSQPHRRSMKL